MLININTFTVQPGKQAEVKEAWLKIQQALKEMQPEATRTGTLSVTGSNPGARFTMITTFNSFADWEKSRELRKDPKHQKIRKLWGDVFVPGSREFTVHEVIS